MCSFQWWDEEQLLFIRGPAIWMKTKTCHWAELAQSSDSSSLLPLKWMWRGAPSLSLSRLCLTYRKKLKKCKEVANSNSPETLLFTHTSSAVCLFSISLPPSPPVWRPGWNAEEEEELEVNVRRRCCNAWGLLSDEGRSHTLTHGEPGGIFFVVCAKFKEETCQSTDPVSSTSETLCLFTRKARWMASSVLWGMFLCASPLILAFKTRTCAVFLMPSLLLCHFLHLWSAPVSRSRKRFLCGTCCGTGLSTRNLPPLRKFFTFYANATGMQSSVLPRWPLLKVNRALCGTWWSKYRPGDPQGDTWRRQGGPPSKKCLGDPVMKIKLYADDIQLYVESNWDIYTHLHFACMWA